MTAPSWVRARHGEVWVRGPQVMQGYWQRPDETKGVLTADGWLRTGDIGVFDAQGFLKLLDRKKDMVIVSGFKVFPNEVEDVAMTQSGRARGGGHRRARRTHRRGGQAFRRQARCGARPRPTFANFFASGW